MAKKIQVPNFLETKKSMFNTKGIDKLYQRLDSYQLEYYNALQEYNIVTCDSPSGTGKSTLAIMAGLQMLNDGKVSKLLYLRFPSGRTLKQGFLPGDQSSKEAILMYPFWDAIESLGIQRETIDLLILDGTIELTTDMTMRGRNLRDTFCVIDESQDATLTDLQCLLTRLHDTSVCALIGHSEQCDIVKPKLYQGLSSFQLYQLHLSKKEFALCCDLPINYRGKVSRYCDAIQETLDELIEGKVML